MATFAGPAALQSTLGQSHSVWGLSARPPEPRSSRMDDKAFRAYYEFDDDDLYLNRQGRLSDKQYKSRMRLEQDSRHYSRIGAVVALVAAALVPCLVLPLSALSLLNKDWTSTLIAWAGSAVWLAIFGGAGLW